MTRLRFGLVNLGVFALLLPAYRVWGGPLAPLALRLVLIVLLGSTGWFGIAFTALALLQRRR